MDNLIFSINATAPIFLTMLLGYVLKRTGLIGEKLGASLNSFVFRVALPVMLFQDLSTQDFYSFWDGKYVLFCVAGSILSILIVCLIARLIVKDRPLRGEFIQASYRSSAAILGFAFIQNIYGEGNTGLAPLMILGSVPIYNIGAVIVLSLTAEGTKRAGAGLDKGLMKKTVLNILSNPIIIGIVIGLLWSLLRIPQHKIFTTVVHNIAVLATPLGLIAIGVGFEPHKAKKSIGLAGAAAFIRLIGLAAIFLPAAIWLGFRGQELVALIVMFASATAVSSYVMAINMGHEGTLTASAVMMTTFFCSFTLAFWLWLMKTLGYV